MLTTVAIRFQTWRRWAPVAGAALLVLPATACTERPGERGLEPVYCYRTLADVTCRTVPDAGREGRLVGVYLRDPEHPAWPDRWLRRRETRRPR